MEENKDKKFRIFINKKNIQIVNYKNELITLDLDLSSTEEISNVLDKGRISSRVVDGIIGLFSYCSYHYLVAIVRSELVHEGINENNQSYSIRKVLDTDFIPFKTYSSIPEHLNRITLTMQNIIKNGFYFSNDYDLSNNILLHNQHLHEITNTKYDYIFDANPYYLANNKFIDYFINNNIGSDFISSCIYGYIGKINYILNNKNPIEVLLISRRNFTCYALEKYNKGLNKNGNLANQIENEFITIYDNTQYYSYLVLTGKTPCYYNELSGLKKFKEIKSFKIYLQSLVEDYGIGCFFNLFDETNQKENELGNKFKKLLMDEIKHNINSNKNFKYYELKTNTIDKNAPTSNLMDDSFGKFLEKNKEIINFFGHTSFNGDTSEKYQKGIISINSNNYLSIEEILKRLMWIIIEDEVSSNIEDSSEIKMERNSPKEDSIFNKLFKLISTAYTFLNKQYQSPTLLTETLIRNYQRALNIIFFPSFKPKPAYHYLSYFKHKFSEISNIYIFAGTWNVGFVNIKENNPNLKSWLIPKNENGNIIPDIYLLGVQKAVPLSVKNIIDTNDLNEILETWEKKIASAISRDNTIQYRKIKVLNLIGIILFVFAKESIAQYITDVNTKILKTGLKGAYGNKGSCITTFNYFNTVISVSCSHFASGIDKNKQRLDELEELLSTKLESSRKINSPESNDNKSIIMNNNNSLSKSILNDYEDKISFFESDIWFIFGDLNFRIDTDYENNIEYISSQNYQGLIEFDQYYKSSNASINLKSKVNESPITFPPTHKFKRGSTEYVNDKKKMPSWCDRILFKAYDKNSFNYISPIEYSSANDHTFYISDHRPVYELFKVEVMKEKPEIKSGYEKEIDANCKFGISSNYMFKSLNN